MITHQHFKNCITSIQPPGLMTMRLMHHRGHPGQGAKHITTVHDVMCHPHSVMLPHEQLHSTLCRATQSR